MRVIKYDHVILHFSYFSHRQNLNACLDFYNTVNDVVIRFSARRTHKSRSSAKYTTYLVSYRPYIDICRVCKIYGRIGSASPSIDLTNPTYFFISPRTKVRDNHWVKPVTWWPYMRLCTVSKFHVRQPVPKIVRREKQDGGQRSCCYGIFWRSICAETI